MAKYTSDTHWRDAARPTKFFGIDAKAALPLLVFLMYARLWTFIAAIICTIFFGILSHYGFTFRVFLVRIRGFLAGPHKTARPWWR